MKLLVFSDLHLDSPFAWAPTPLARRRRQGLRDTLGRIMALAEAEQVDAILCAGDLYEHEHFTPDTVAFVEQSFNRAGRRVLLAPGNHDWLGPGSLYRQAKWSGNVHVFSSDRLQPVELGDGVLLWGAAHLAPANTDGFLTDFHVSGDAIHLALFHGSESSGFTFETEGKQPHAPFDALTIPDTGLSHAFVGHFHTPKLGPWHTYPGNPEPLAFGESGERGAVVVTIGENGTVTREVRAVASTAIHDVDLFLTDINHADQIRTQAAAVLAEVDGVVRLTVSGEVDPQVDVHRNVLDGLGAHLDGLLVRFGPIMPAYDLEEIAAEQTVRGQFFRDVQAAPGLDDNTRRRVIVTGLRALDGRKDLEVL
jgi:DNA repair exonuclease SbcCD nuclease subunit